jgi:hypothetical protein
MTAKILKFREELEAEIATLEEMQETASFQDTVSILFAKVLLDRQLRHFNELFPIIN